MLVIVDYEVCGRAVRGGKVMKEGVVQNRFVEVSKIYQKSTYVMLWKKVKQLVAERELQIWNEEANTVE